MLTLLMRNVGNLIILKSYFQYHQLELQQCNYQERCHESINFIVHQQKLSHLCGNFPFKEDFLIFIIRHKPDYLHYANNWKIY